MRILRSRSPTMSPTEDKKEWTREKGGRGRGMRDAKKIVGGSIRNGSLELAVTPHLVAARTGTTSQPATQECLRTEPGL
jgi:hypothetical protein